jgi:hypothetical protein
MSMVTVDLSMPYCASLESELPIGIVESNLFFGTMNFLIRLNLKVNIGKH